MSTFSLHGAFAGSTVLITGVTGYIGSLCLEQLLRIGGIHKAYVLMRPKRSQEPRERLKQLLAGPVFSQHQEPAVLQQVLSRLEVIPGDLAQDRCGLSAADEQRLLRDVEFVLHVAASIQFDNSIHTDLTLSYVATRSLADMAAQMPRLRCMMYVSTAYSNSHLPRGSTVQEQLYPLKDQHGHVIDHAALVGRLLGMPADAAQAEVGRVMQQHSFLHTTYAFCKNLTEQMLAGYGSRFPICINRPVSVGCVAHGPCAGFVGNTSGATGVILSIGSGVAGPMSRSPNNPYTLVPGDVAASVITAHMAAAGTGAWRSGIGPTITHSCTSVSRPLLFGDFVAEVQEFFRTHPPEHDYYFGDGKFAVAWHTDLQEYEKDWAAGSQWVEDLAAGLEAQGKARSAARARTAWKVWRTWSYGRRETGLRFDDSNVHRVLAKQLAQHEQDSVRVAFTKMSWQKYIGSYCAGAKQLFMQSTTAEHLSSAPKGLSSL